MTVAASVKRHAMVVERKKEWEGSDRRLDRRGRKSRVLVDDRGPGCVGCVGEEDNATPQQGVTGKGNQCRGMFAAQRRRGDRNALTLTASPSPSPRPVARVGVVSNEAREESASTRDKKVTKRKL
jgi:hypothetical protein